MFMGRKVGVEYVNPFSHLKKKLTPEQLETVGNFLSYIFFKNFNRQIIKNF